jgi:predicted ABC-type ATPase
MANLYIISGCNGAGKTTASYTVLPEMLNCKEFVNADEIAKGLSPFQPEKVSIEAGKIMLTRIRELLKKNIDFAFETTLATRMYARLIREAKENGYFVTLLYFWLNTPELALERVRTRVLTGGHDVQPDVVRRRYFNGLTNLPKLYLPICDYWMLIDNSQPPYEIVAEGYRTESVDIQNHIIYKQIIAS